MPGPAYQTIWALLVYAWVANYIIRMAPGALLPPIMEELEISYAMAGFLSAAFFYGYMAMQFPAGFLGDRFGRKRMLLAGVLVGAAASAMTGLAGSFAALFAARALTGLAQGFLFSNDRVIIASTTPQDKMALGQGISFSGPGVGTTLGLFLAGVMAEALPWRAVFYVFALPPLLAAVLIWRLIPEPPRLASHADPDWPFRRVLVTRDFWLLALAGIIPVYIQFTLATWGALFFAEIGVTDLGRSAALASLQGIVAPLGLLASGLLADRIHRQGVNRKVVIAGALGCAAASSVGMAVVIRAQGSPLLLTVLMLAASFSIWSTWGPAYAIFGDMFPPSVLGRAFGLLNCVCFVGAIVGPHLTGWIRDLSGSLAAGLLTAGALAVAAALTALALRPTVPRPQDPSGVAR